MRDVLRPRESRCTGRTNARAQRHGSSSAQRRARARASRLLQRRTRCPHRRLRELCKLGVLHAPRDTRPAACRYAGHRRTRSARLRSLRRSRPTRAVSRTILATGSRPRLRRAPLDARRSHAVHDRSRRTRLRCGARRASHRPDQSLRRIIRHATRPRVHASVPRARASRGTPRCHSTGSSNRARHGPRRRACASSSVHCMRGATTLVTK